jgi:hypothetical protein
MNEAVIRVVWPSLQRAFAMMALAMLANKSRDEITQFAERIPGFSYEPITAVETVLHLQDCVERGDVTCIIKDPQPFLYLYYRTPSMSVRMVYGLWIGRQASWRGTRDPLKRAVQSFEDYNKERSSNGDA